MRKGVRDNTSWIVGIAIPEDETVLCGTYTKYRQRLNSDIISTTDGTKNLISNIAEAMSPFANEAKIYVQYMNPNPEGNKWIGFYVTEGTWEEFKLRTGVTSSFDKVCEILKQNNGKETAEGLPVTGIENKNGRLYVKFSRTSNVQ